MKKLPQTPSQTVGPYFAYGLTPEQYQYDFKSSFSHRSGGDPLAPHTGVTIIGRVLDGAGKTIPDAMVEVWDGEHLTRVGTGTDPENRFVFEVNKPAPESSEAPNLTVVVFMRGQLIHSFTRIYFSDEAAANAQDPVLNSVPPERRHTLVAQDNGHFYAFDIRMQGENETVFFDY